MSKTRIGFILGDFHEILLKVSGCTKVLDYLNARPFAPMNLGFQVRQEGFSRLPQRSPIGP
jgi:hypothetical protein